MFIVRKKVLMYYFLFCVGIMFLGGNFACLVLDLYSGNDLTFGIILLLGSCLFVFITCGLLNSSVKK